MHSQFRLGASVGFLVVLALCIVPRAFAQTAGNGATVSTNIPGTVVYLPPPPGFNPITASAADLNHYGFPPRPDQKATPNAYSRWIRESETQRVVPELLLTNVIHGPIQGLSEVKAVKKKKPTGPTIKTANSMNWSGYVITASPGTFSAVFPTGQMKNNADLTYAVPYAQPPIANGIYGSCDTLEYYSSQWVGIDGFVNTDVLQAGTSADANCNRNENNGGAYMDGSTNYPTYYAWYEWYAQGCNPGIGACAEVLVLFPGLDEYEDPGDTGTQAFQIATGDYYGVSAGDVMGIHVAYSATAPQGHVYIADLTKNYSASIAFDPPPQVVQATIGDSVEWIMEAPAINGVITNHFTNYIGAVFYGVFDESPYNTLYSPVTALEGDTIYNVTLKQGSNVLSQVNPPYVGTGPADGSLTVLMFAGD